MRKFNYTVLAILLTAFAFSTVRAQDETPTDTPPQNFNQQRRPNLLAELDLTKNQIQEIRRINQDSKSKRQEAHQRVIEAQKALDRAIYADSADEAEIQTLLKNFQTAQAEVFKIKAMTEFAVRNILTPEQLVKFREIRQRFMERMENFKPQNNRPLNAPNQKLLNRRRLRNNN